MSDVVARQLCARHFQRRRRTGSVEDPVRLEDPEKLDIRMPGYMVDRLERIAKRCGVSRNAIVRNLLDMTSDSQLTKAAHMESP
jgi:hypothetical protein